MKKLTSIILSGLMVLSITLFNVTPAKAASNVHDGMNVVIGINNLQTNPYIDNYVYPEKIRVNEKFNVYVLFADDGHDISMAYCTDGANGFTNYNSNGWESSPKMETFSGVSFSTPGRHAVFATMFCKQTGNSKTVSFYIDVI